MSGLLTKLRETVGRKLGSLIVGPILSSLIMAVNALLPPAAQLTADQVANVVQWIIGTVVIFIAAQGTVDAVKANKPPVIPVPLMAPVPQDQQTPPTFG